MSAQPNASTQRKRLVGDRFRRVWSVAQTIADEPGHSRLELADRFFMSERQIQADLNIIRTDMRLPLVRERGYRYAAEGPAVGSGALDLQEVQLLALVLAAAKGMRGVPKERLDALVAKLPSLFPAHLQPFAERTLGALLAPRSEHQGRLFAALGEAIVCGAWVRLHRLPMAAPLVDGSNPIVRPELLIPYLSRWYLLADTQARSRSAMFDLETLTAVTLSPEIPDADGGVR